MIKPGLLQTGPLLPIIEKAIGEAFTVRRVWELGEANAINPEIANSIEAIATGGQIRVDAALMRSLPNLHIVANFGVGYDSVDAAWAGQNRIVVTNTPDVLTEEVADTTIGLLLMTVRELGAAERHLREGKWPADNYPLTPMTLRTRSVGILGLGRIGKAVAHRLEAFGVPISYFGRRKQPDVSYTYYDSLIGMAEAVDTLVSVLPGTEQTHHLINMDVMRALGPNGVVVNIGRGSVVDEAALIEALQHGVILSAGLDVFEFEPEVPDALIAMERLTLLPHVGSASVHTRDAMGQLVVDNLLAYTRDQPPPTPVLETPFNGWD